MLNLKKLCEKIKFWYKQYQYRNKFNRYVYREMLREEFNIFKKDKYIEDYYRKETEWLTSGFELNEYLDKMYEIFIQRKFQPICIKLGYLYPSFDNCIPGRENQICLCRIENEKITNMIFFVGKDENPYEEVYLGLVGFTKPDIKK